MLAGCGSRVRLEAPATPTVHVPTRAVAVISNGRACRGVADRLAEHLRSATLSVHPEALARVTVLTCNHSWAPAAPGEVAGRGQALARLAVQGETRAQLIGAASATETGTTNENQVRLRRRAGRMLDDRVARDLAEQLAPEPIPVVRRVYPNTPAGTARSFHNLAVAAERDGRWEDALWWAELAHERRPSSDRARYVEELARRLHQSGSAPPSL
jgi:hypothetical protein